PLFSFSGKADLFVTYEQLVLEPEVVVDNLIATLSLESGQRISESVHRLSGSVSRSSDASIEILQERRSNAFAEVGKWLKECGDERDRWLMDIVEMFGITAYTRGSLLHDSLYWLPELNWSGELEQFRSIQRLESM